MNKTLTVNIGGLVFHIEEIAYQKLDQYLKAIRSSISIKEQDEVIHDIEIRIAEIFSEKITSSNQVVTIVDVERVIEIMGSPEDYKLNDDESTTDSSTNYGSQYIYTKQPKLYRDTQKGLLGGVLAGLSHYLKIDIVWIRLIFLVLFFFYGTGVLVYLIMWIVIPAARTSSEILEMKGEPININTIEQKVKENIDYVANKFNNLDTEGLKRQMNSTGTRLGTVVQKVAGIIFVITASFGLLGSIIASIALSVNSSWLSNTKITVDGNNLNQFPFILNDTYPSWVFVCVISLIMILPFIGLLLIGLRLLYNNIKYVLPSLISLFILWIISIIVLVIPFMNMNSYKFSGKLGLENSAFEMKMSDDFDLEKKYKEIKVIAVTSDFFKTNKKDATPYLIDESTEIDNISFEVLPTYQYAIYGKLTLKLNSDNNKGTSITVSELDDFYDVENNILYVAADKNGLKNMLQYTIYLPETTKVYFLNNYANITSSFNGKLDKKTFYTMSNQQLIQAELH